MLSGVFTVAVLMVLAASLPAGSAAKANADTYSPFACGVIAQGYKVVPGSDWGTTTAEVQAKWTASQCDLKICAYYVSKYGIVPGQAEWGTMPQHLVPGWSWDRPGGKGNCDNIWAAAAAGGVITPAPAAKTTMKNARTAPAAVRSIAGRAAEINAGTDTYSAFACGVIAEGYKVVPGSDWGTTTGEMQDKWTRSYCDLRICAYYVSKYGIVPGPQGPQHWGAMPSNLKNAWSWDRPNGQGNCNNLWAAAAAGNVPITPTA